MFLQVHLGRQSSPSAFLIMKELALCLIILAACWADVESHSEPWTPCPTRQPPTKAEMVDVRKSPFKPQPTCINSSRNPRSTSLP